MFIPPSRISTILKKDLGFTEQKTNDKVKIFSRKNPDAPIQTFGQGKPTLRSSNFSITLQSSSDSIMLRIWDNFGLPDDVATIRLLGHFSREIKIPQDCPQDLESFTYELFGRIIAIEY